MFALLNPAKRTHKLNFFRNVSGYVASYRVRGMHAFSNGKLMAIDFYRCTVKRCILLLHLDCTDNRESVGRALIKIKVSAVYYISCQIHVEPDFSRIKGRLILSFIVKIYPHVWP